MENELKIEAEKLSPQEQFMLRKQIVALRKGGKTTAEVVELLGVKKRHVQSTWKKYSESGLKAIALKKMGRPKGDTSKLRINWLSHNISTIVSYRCGDEHRVL